MRKSGVHQKGLFEQNVKEQEMVQHPGFRKILTISLGLGRAGKGDGAVERGPRYRSCDPLPHTEAVH